MAAFSLRRSITPLTHVLVWGLFGLTLVLINPLLGRITLPAEFWIKQAVAFGLWIIIFYLTANVSVPRLLFRGHIGWFVVVLLATAVAVVLLTQALSSWLHLQQIMDQILPRRAWPTPRGAGAGAPDSHYRFDSMGLLTTLFVLGISISVSTVQKWQQDAQQRQELEQQKVSSELLFLKAQINPHFFFNTLNNIYALTLLDGEAARQSLLTLSRMMRYVLYETPTGTTPLAKELAFVQDYVTLMKLRLTDKVQVCLEWPEPMYDVPVAPMLLLPFVENAFKHGVSATLPSRIAIAVRQPTPTTLELDVRNTRFSAPTSTLEESNGIGLANTRRRLDLLYPGRFTLLITDASPEQDFRVHLTLHTV